MTKASVCPPPPPRSYHHGDLRNALLDAAEALLARRPTEAPTLREVARLAGVSHAAPYHHFESREALLAAVAERGFAQLGESMAQARASSDDVEAQLAALSENYVAFALARPTLFRLMFGPLLTQKQKYPNMQKSSEASFGAMLAASAAFAPKNALGLSLVGWSLLHGIANLAIDGILATAPTPGPLPDAPTLARQLIVQVLRGELQAPLLSARPPSPPPAAARRARPPRKPAADGC